MAAFLSESHSASPWQRCWCLALLPAGERATHPPLPPHTHTHTHTHLQELSHSNCKPLKEVFGIRPLTNTVHLPDVLLSNSPQHRRNVVRRVLQVLNTHLNTQVKLAFAYSLIITHHTLQDHIRLRVTTGVHHPRAINEVDPLH